MNKNQSLVLFAIAATIIGIVAMAAAVYILADDKPANDGSVAQILTYSTGLIVAIFALRSMLDSIHTTMNSRLDELVKVTKEAAFAEGQAAGRKREEDRDKTVPVGDHLPETLKIQNVEVERLEIKKPPVGGEV